jgi:tripartite-type tricarboxylate transporter receptor subunit TctC
MKLAYFFSGPAALLLAIIAVSGAAAGDYPERGIRLLYGFPPGADTVVRMLADRLAEILQKPIIVENLTALAATSWPIIPLRPSRMATPSGC